MHGFVIIGTLIYVLNRDHSSVLMVHRHKRSTDDQLGFYNGLGGKMEDNETIVECMQRELKEKSAKLTCEKENAEAKFEAKRKQVKELESRLQREVANAEREKAVLILKQQNLENQHESLQKNLESQLIRLREEN